MKPEEIHLYDLQRMLIGEVPGTFFIEIVIRVLFLLLLLIVSLRLMGRRMAAALTRNEMAALTSLAAAIGVPIVAPDRALLPALIIAAVVIGYQRIIYRLTFRNKKMERAILDHRDFLVVDGCLNLKGIERSGLSQERVFAQLRSEGIDNLGKVQRLYFEPSSKLTLLEAEEPKPGLPILPDWDNDYIEEKQTLSDQFACCHCGQVVKAQQTPHSPCPRCGNTEWREAVLEPGR